MKWIFIALIVIHGLIHALGFMQAVSATSSLKFEKPVSISFGVLWLAASILFVATAALLALSSRHWWIAATFAVVVSQWLIILWWKDARFGTIANALIIVPAIIAAAGALPGSFFARFKADTRVGLERFIPQPVLTEQDIFGLPAPVQKYIRRAGAIGKPKVVNFHIKFKGQIQPSPEGKMGDFTAEQYSFVDEPTRLFLIDSAMFGLPFGAYHRYVGPSASMEVKVLNLFRVVDARGPEMNQSENVTMLNDMCIMAPASLISPRISWEPVDETHAKASYTYNGSTVSALLTFSPDGDLIDFISEDRYQSADGKTYLKYPWRTPLTDYRDFHGIRLAAKGQAIWKQPTGDFTYGTLELVDIEYNKSPTD